RQRRNDLSPGELQGGRWSERAAAAVRRGQGQGDGRASREPRLAHDRNPHDRSRDLTLPRRALGAVAVLLAALACRPAAPSGFTLLFLGRSPAATQSGLSWAPDPERSRLVAFDGQLRLARVLSSPRLGEPMAVSALGENRLLVTERIGDAVVL